MGVQAVAGAKVGAERGARIQTGKDGRVEQEGLGKGTACKHWLLFQGLDQASSDLSGTSDETVQIITNNRRQRIHCGHLRQVNSDLYTP